MAVKKTASRKAKAKPKSAAKRKPAAKKKAAVKKGDAYECGVCGYRIVVDEVCGCEEEHVFICCDQPMEKR
jgi:hypothetical protein